MLYEIIAKTNENKFTVRFTGGEPLMYMDKMRRIVEYLKPLADRIHYLTVTNGTLLTEEIVQFFNENHFEVGISNDGEHTIKTRGVNVLDDEKLTRLICAIENMHFVCVYSSVNADYQANIEYFKSKMDGRRHNVQAAMNPVYNTGFINDQELFNFDFGLVKKSVNSFYDGITTEQFCDVNSPEYYLLMRYINKFRDVYNKAAEGIDITSKIACGTDYNHINIDTKGNAYFCHNCSDKIGTIENTLTELFDVYRQRGAYELTNSMECVTCEARPICCGGCPFVDREQRRSYYCQIQKTIVAAVVRALYRLHGGFADAV